MQRIHFWGGLFGLLFTLMIGVQFWTDSLPWRVQLLPFQNGVLVIEHEDVTYSAGDDSNSIQFEVQPKTELRVGRVLFGLLGIGLTVFGVIGAPVWLIARSGLDRLPDTARAKRVIICWVGLPVLMCVWVMSNLIAAVT